MDYVYVDNSNLYIEGRRVSAVKRKLARNITDAMQNDILDHGYTVSFGKLHEFLCGKDKRQIKRAALFGSRPPPNDGIWKYAKKAGFELHLEDRNFSNREKKIDTGIATLITKDAYKYGNAKETYLCWSLAIAITFQHSKHSKTTVFRLKSSSGITRPGNLLTWPQNLSD